MPHFGEISAKEHYLLRMMLCLAPSYYSEKPISLAKISTDEQISLKYLEQLVRPFVEAGWIKSARGRVGGYIMIKDPATINLKLILWADEQDHASVQCLSDAQPNCPLENRCLSKHAWEKVQKALEQALEDVVLSDLLELRQSAFTK
ncbi:MAG TPA: Rrf2 family transcriptional regulator [Patescibacteria group bacterium]|nr:Rrf2 family transcriptional regulator [Patescibacteria group bacterium]